MDREYTAEEIGNRMFAYEAEKEARIQARFKHIPPDDGSDLDVHDDEWGAKWERNFDASERDYFRHMGWE